MEFLDDLGDEARNRVEADIDFLGAEPGMEIGPPTYKHIRARIWEIRTPTREGAIRTLFGLDGRLPCFSMASRRSVRSSTLATWSWPKPGLRITCGGKGYEAKQKKAPWESAPFC
jgi:hypothetical protein